jgi:subtilase family serine protease
MTTSRNSGVKFYVLAAAVLASVCLTVSAAAAADGIDRGPMRGLERAAPISVTVALALPGRDEAEQLLRAIYSPGDPQYHHFLTPEEFIGRFGPTEADIADVIKAFTKYGLTAERTSGTTIKLTGLPDHLERAFSVSLHTFEVAARGDAPGRRFHAPIAHATAPAEIASRVSGLVGLDNRPHFTPRLKTLPSVLRAASTRAPATKSGNPFGLLTVADFAQNYDVQPLYNAGVTGSGRTLGIMTLAAFDPGDAYSYWQQLGLTVDPNRITIVNVDGGPGAPSDASGSIETTLDVEQSGGIAPGAKIVVYQAPNTNQGFVDLFAAAVMANKADTLSISWGLWEWFDELGNSPVIDPLHSPNVVDTTTAIHELLLQAAIQGQSVFTASGDSGAYELNGDLGCFGPYDAGSPGSCALALSVDYPASDPLITAAGGTTLAGHQVFCLNSACTPPYYQIQIPQESVWGWDYLSGLCAALGAPDPISCGTFPAGGGGGVSVAFPLPSYQAGLPGIRLSQPGQNFLFAPFGLLYPLPANYAGRNLPDISANADPETGYVILYKSVANTFWGGTSFVAPQLNGVAALLNQYLNKRVGFLNIPLYSLAASGAAYAGGSKSPLNAVSRGDNWFYSGSAGYNQGAGLGTLDVRNLAQYLSTLH